MGKDHKPRLKRQHANTQSNDGPPAPTVYYFYIKIVQIHKMLQIFYKEKNCNGSIVTKSNKKMECTVQNYWCMGSMTYDDQYIKIK